MGLGSGCEGCRDRRETLRVGVPTQGAWRYAGILLCALMAVKGEKTCHLLCGGWSL